MESNLSLEDILQLVKVREKIISIINTPQGICYEPPNENNYKYDLQLTY